jgi:dihydropteroate synthase
MDRLIPVVEAIRSRLPDAVVSIDTWRANVARESDRRAGIHMINDISAGSLDPEMFNTVAALNLPYVMMHMRGTPASMQESPAYNDVVDDLLQFFAERIHTLRRMGVNDLVVDPGFGFGKNRSHNFTLLNELEAFRMLELPLMVGISRKGMVYQTLGVEIEHALNGTTALHMAALLKGAQILRVHDVRAARETVILYEQIVGSSSRSE